MEKRPVDIEKIRAFLDGDAFARHSGIVIEDAQDGTSVCSMAVTPMHSNGWGAVMGGAIFTLADFAFAAASCGGHVCYGEALMVSRDISITFLRPAVCEKLTAKAEIEHSGRTACFARVNVYNDSGKLVSVAVVNGARTGRVEGA